MSCEKRRVGSFDWPLTYVFAGVLPPNCHPIWAWASASQVRPPYSQVGFASPLFYNETCTRSKEWTGDYITDFSKLLPASRTDGFTYDEVGVRPKSVLQHPGFLLRHFPRASMRMGPVMRNRIFPWLQGSTNQNLSRGRVSKKLVWRQTELYAYQPY